jgi:putative transposase
MPRRARPRIPGLPLHVMQRGNNRSACFAGARECRVYLALLDELADLHGCSVHAYVLMTNHVHLLLTPAREDSVSVLMKHLGQRYVQYVNRKHTRCGTLWSGRFKSCVVDSERYLLTCLRYIELNPVRARMVRHPGEYPWSSYGTNAEGKSSDFLVPHPQFLALGSNDEERRRTYRALFEEELTPAMVQRIRDATNGGFALGSEEFVDQVERDFGVKLSRKKPGRPASE